MLLVIALVGGGLALLWPYGHWRRRLVVAGLALGGSVSLIALGSYVCLLLQVVPRYDGLNGTAAALGALSYHDSPLLNAQLVQAAGQLPAGTVLMRASDEEEYRVLRARYLFHPRPVLPIAPAGALDPVPQLIAQGATVLIGDSGEPQPAPGWQQLTTPDGPLVIWYNPAAVHLPPDPSPGVWAMPRLLLSLLLLWGAGWALAGMVGLSGGLRILAAWACGVILLGWLMTAMTWLGLPWAWWSVGLPLLGMSLAGLGWRTGGGAARRVPVALHTLRGWEWGVLGVLLCLCAGVILYALLMPVGDRDSWAMWAFKGQAFARDGAIAPVLRLYRQSDLHHPGYPPTQPLMQVWTYLAVGGIDERMAQLSFPVWYASCLGLVWWAGWRWSGRRSAWAWTLLLATTPIVLDHATGPRKS